MKIISSFLLIFVTACGPDQPVPSAQQKYDEFFEQASLVKTGTEFTDLAMALGHECERGTCDEFCQADIENSNNTADETLVCRWDEDISAYSAVVFGTVFSVVHLSNDQIVHRNIEIIYTGP